MDPMVQMAVANQCQKIAKLVEDQVDTELEKLDRVFEQKDVDELEVIREKRLAQLKKAAKDRDEWLSKGHGEYKELQDEKSFFDSCKDSDRVVCHFYRNSSERCKIVDKHLSSLAKSHVETNFVKLDAEKSPFLTGRLNITVLPTLVIFKDGSSVDRIIGFTELGNHDEFSTEMLEWRLGQKDGVFYDGNKDVPPEHGRKKQPLHFSMNPRKKNIRGSNKSGSGSDDDDVEYTVDKMGSISNLTTTGAGEGGPNED